MAHERDRAGTARRLWLLAAVLTLACVVFLPGIDTLGVYGWQEGQRLLVARQMQDRLAAASDGHGAADALLVPRVHGVAYLAKPPMIYWTQMGLALLMREAVELRHLRLVVAFAGILGVGATFFVARWLLRPEGASSDARGLEGVRLDERWVDHAAAWSAAFLATGVLFVRSGRIGELDVLLALFCALSIGLVARAWVGYRRTRRVRLLELALAAFSAACAALTKDPGVLIIGLAVCGGVVMHAAFGASHRRLSRGVLIASVIVGVVAIAFSLRTAESAPDGFGAAIIGAMAALVVATLLKLTDPAARRSLWEGLKATQPWLVLGAGVLASVAWRFGVTRIIGETEAEALLSQEVGDNVRVLIAEAPLNNLKACLFGVGMGSGLAIFGAIWMLKERPRLTPGMAVLVAWITLNLVAFSMLGKGVQRYLTPTWPALAILGGLTMATLVARYRFNRLLPRLSVAAVVLLGVGQAFHYGYGRQLFWPELSPREFMERLSRTPGVNIDRLVSYEFSSPAVSFYARQKVDSVGEDGVNASMSGGEALTVDQLKDQIRRDGQALALVRVTDEPNEEADPRTALGELKAAGFAIEPVPVDAKFIEPSGTELRCYRLTIAR